MKGCIYPRGKGTWALVIDLPRGADGKRRQKWITVKGTKREAQAELTRIVHEMNTGAFVEPSKMTVGEYLAKWLADYAKTNVAAKTYERYAEIIRLNLAPALGQHPLTGLRPLHIQAFYSHALTSGRRQGDGGLSAQTVLHLHRVLHRALDQAVKWQLLARNPCDAVEPPRPERKEMRVLDTDAILRLLATARDGRLYVPILLAVTTGLRRGEVLALRWEDVDLQAGTLSVRQSVEQTNDGLRFKAPKTAKSRRVVALPAVVVEELVRHKGKQVEEKLLLGPAYHDRGLVVAQPDGTVWNPETFTKAFIRLIGNADVTKVRFHDLRHTHATHLLEQNIHPKVVSERLGHSTIAITLDTYSHVLPGMQEEAARRVDAALRTTLGQS